MQNLDERLAERKFTSAEEFTAFRSINLSLIASYK